MAPEVLQRKLAFIRQLLADLRDFEDATLTDVIKHHYAVERILELLAMAATDILFHLLGERGLTPASYRDSFRMAAEQGLLPEDLAESLTEMASMRNLLVHLYERIDYTILHASIVPALNDFAEFVAALEARLDE